MKTYKWTQNSRDYNISITVFQCLSGCEKLFYFGVSIGDNENEVVYRPKFVKLAWYLTKSKLVSKSTTQEVAP